VGQQEAKPNPIRLGSTMSPKHMWVWQDTTPNPLKLGPPLSASTYDYSKLLDPTLLSFTLSSGTCKFNKLLSSPLLHYTVISSTYRSSKLSNLKFSGSAACSAQVQISPTRCQIQISWVHIRPWCIWV
jgi:hypothetical protein